MEKNFICFAFILILVCSAKTSENEKSVRKNSKSAKNLFFTPENHGSSVLNDVNQNGQRHQAAFSYSYQIPQVVQASPYSHMWSNLGRQDLQYHVIPINTHQNAQNQHSSHSQNYNNLFLQNYVPQSNFHQNQHFQQNHQNLQNTHHQTQHLQNFHQGNTHNTHLQNHHFQNHNLANKNFQSQHFQNHHLQNLHEDSKEVPISDDDTVVLQNHEIGPEVQDDYWTNSFSEDINLDIKKIVGFQRGQVESIPESAKFYQNIKVKSAGEEEGGEIIGFNRAAVEARPDGVDLAITYDGVRSETEMRVICYFANWAFYRQGAGKYLPENVDPNLCTHVIYAFGSYDKMTMGVKESDPEVDSGNNFMSRIAGLKKINPKLKILLAIGGWSDSGDNKYSTLASSQVTRKKFATESLVYLKRKNFDGISIDWHYPVCWQSDCTRGPPSDKFAFTELIKELRGVYEKEGFLVAASLSGYKEVIDVAYDIPKLSDNLDFMSIMTYDYHGSWESRTGHLSPLYEGPPSEDLKPAYNSNFTMEYYVSKGAERSKLVLGVPFYGQSFKLENQFDQSLGSLAEGPGNAGESTQQPGMLSYYEICKRVKDDGWTVRKDTSGSWGPYAFKGDQWVGYDDPDSIRRKARHVVANGFGGIFAFTLDLDDFNNECCGGDQVLLRTISKEILGIPFSPKKNDCSKPGPTSKPKPEPMEQTTSSAPVPPQNPPTEICFYSTKPNPLECNSYYRCVGGREIVEKCPFALHWNNKLQACDWPQTAGCSSSATQTQIVEMQTRPPQTSSSSTGMRCTTGEYFKGPNCDQYYLCSNGLKKLQNCGPGLHWNNDKMLCDWPKEANCALRSEVMNDESAMKIGESCTEGEFTGAKRDCDMYTVCVHGKRVEFRCQGGLYWNNEMKVCDWPSNVKCTPNAGNSPSSTSTEFVPTMGPTTQKPSTIFPVITPSKPVNEGSKTTPAPQFELPQVGLPTSDLSGDFMIVCYFTNWAFYRPGVGKYTPDNINPDLCTHIIYGFAVLDPETLLIKPHDTWADIDNDFYGKVTALKKQGKKVSVAIGGWNDSAGGKYSKLVSNPAFRSRFIRNVLEFIQKYNFDGLDLDWEYPKCWQVECDKGPDSDKPNFASFVRELKEIFRPKGLLLSSAVSPSKTVIDAGYDVPTLSRYLDFISVMTYDFHGQWDKKTGHVAPLYFHEEDDVAYFNANYSINYWISRGAERKKIVMGIPLYGQSFTLSDPNSNGLNAPSSGGGREGEYTRASGFLSYYEICTNVMKNGWTVVEDESGAMGPYAYKDNQWVSYDDVKMVRRKAELIRSLDIGGGMVWALDLDDFQNICGQGSSPLLSTIRSVLGRKKTGTSFIDAQKLKPISQVIESNKKQTVFPIRTEDVDHCDDQFRDHESNCKKYYQCLFGRYVEQTCPPGTVWNRDRCDWPGNAQCKPGGGSVSSMPKPKPVDSTVTQRPKPIIPTPPPNTQSTTYRPPNITPSKFTTTVQPTKDPEWCRLNWCPTEKPLPPNNNPLVNVPPSPYKVVCYFTNWAWYRPGAGKYKPEDIDYNLCTHIAYGFAVLNPETLVIRPHDGWADIDNRFYKQVTLLRSRGIKVVLALGGWNDSLGDKYSRLANDPAARARFIRHAIEFIETWEFDGLDLDWEYPKCWQVDCDKGPDSDKQGFASLVRELKEAFEPRQLLLSAAVSPNKKVIDLGYDVPTVSRYLDWISVMTYDFHGQWDKKTGHNAPFYHHPESETPFFNTNFSINYWIEQGADPKKIIMGMPLYGQSFTLVDSKNTGLNSKTSGGATAGEFTRSAGFLSYYEICTYVKKRDWTVVKDPSGAIGPYAYKGNQWVSFDDVDQLRRKSEYIKQMGLGGGMIWALDLDDFRNVCNCEPHPLLKTINRVLRNYPGADPRCSIS